jgi:hypothetical protein
MVLVLQGLQDWPVRLAGYWLHSVVAECLGIRYHEVSMAPSRTPAGILPSLRAFSRRVISAKVFAFLINSSTRFFSVSVNLTREMLSVPLELAVEMAGLTDLDEREERSFWASSVGSAKFP